MTSDKQQQMAALFEQHVGAELEGDLDTTMATMSDDPHVNHVPTMAGGVGLEGVRAPYRHGDDERVAHDRGGPGRRRTLRPLHAHDGDGLAASGRATDGKGRGDGRRSDRRIPGWENLP